MSRRKPRGRPLDGWQIIDKPPGLTSTDVVNRVRRAFDAQKAGHGGTLDPLATGVLPIAFGAAIGTGAAPGKREGESAHHSLRKSSGSMPACRRIARNVPSGTSPGWLRIAV